MKKQVLFSLCLTAASALVVTGCATKQEVATTQAEQEAIELNRQEEQQVEAEVNTTATPETVEIEPNQPAPEAQGPAAQAPATATETPVAEGAATPKRPKPVPYKVTAGDSISALSVRFNVRKPDILALNPALRENPNNLRIGQTVFFPAGTDVSVKAKPRAPKPAPSASATVYTVQSGDVLGTIARKHGLSVAKIKEANNLKSDNIWVGQKLVLPAGAKKSADKAPTKSTTKAAAKPAELKPVKPAEPKPAQAEPKAAEPSAPAEQMLVVPEQSGEEALPPPPATPIVTPEDTVPPVPQPAQVAAPAEDYTTYIVGEKEDLVSISLKFNVLLTDLRAANNLEDTTNNAVAPGTALRIPNR